MYDAFAVLLQPVQSDLDVPTWVVTGAFSVALLVSALMAPVVGRWNDRGHAAQAITLGGVVGAALLAVWALAPGLMSLYLVWAGLGVCMAAALYEPAFAIVTRMHASPDDRLRALAMVTLFGGLASTVFLPLTAGLVEFSGWRGATGVLAVLLVLSTVLTLFGLPRTPVEASHRGTPSNLAERSAAPRDFRFLTVVFGVCSLASASFIANLIPTLGERGVQPTTAALLGGLFGVMQLPGRALMASPRANLSGPTLLAVSLGLQALGLVFVAAVPTTAALAVGVMAFAVGSGLTTLTRPYLVQSIFAVEHTGFVNGRLARAQQLTRAVGPIAASGVASATSQATVLIIMSVTLAALASFVVDRGVRAIGRASFEPNRRLQMRGQHLSSAVTRTRTHDE